MIEPERNVIKIKKQTCRWRSELSNGHKENVVF